MFGALLREIESCGQIQKTAAGTETRRAIPKKLGHNDSGPCCIKRGVQPVCRDLNSFNRLENGIVNTMHIYIRLKFIASNCTPKNA